MNSFNKMYDSFEKQVFVVKPSDMQKIINKLGEDVYDGVCQLGPDGTRYEDRVEFKQVWPYYLHKFEKDGVLFKPYLTVQEEGEAVENSPQKQKE